MSDRIVVIFATLLILQPIDWAKLIYALCNPDYVAGESPVSYTHLDVYKRQTLRRNETTGRIVTNSTHRRFIISA